MPHDFNHRLNRLELVWSKPSCPACLGRPSRVVTIDAATDEELSANLPADGCPECGTPIFREYRVVADESRSR